MPMIESRGTQGAGSSEAILRAVANAARLFARDPWEITVKDVLRQLGEATGVSRSYVYQNSVSPEGEILMSERFEWCRAGVPATIFDPAYRDCPYRPDFSRWERVLGGGTTIFAPAKDFPEVERKVLESENVLSTAFVPIFVGKTWWGFLGFDDCATEREWASVELDALEAAVETLAVAIARDQMNMRLEEAEVRFRSHVEQLPAITYIEEQDSKDETYDEAYISPQIERILGYTAEEWRADKKRELWRTIVHPEDLEKVDLLDKESTETGAPFVAEYRIRHRDGGRWVWIRDEAHLVRSETETGSNWHGVMVDVTAQKNAENRVLLVDSQA